MNPPSGKNALKLGLALGLFANLNGCALWNPLDHDNYIGRADAELVIEGKSYRASWKIPIHRVSSFNPYSDSGRQDEWQFEWGQGAVTLDSGATLLIDASQAVSENDRPRLLGITGAQPIKRPPRSPEMLTANHPITVVAPVYTTGLEKVPYQGPCGNSLAKGCQALIRISVPSDYVPPYDCHPANYLRNPAFDLKP